MTDEYPSYAAENTKSEWDARQIYARDLQTLDMQANEIKMKLEMHQYKTDEIGDFLNCYLSYLRTMFRMLYYLFDEKAVKGHEKDGVHINGISEEIDDLKGVIGGIQQKIREDGEYPQDIEDRLERLHNKLNGKRFERGLVVPMSMPRDESGVDGWQGTS